jgi:hypothetical protein
MSGFSKILLQVGLKVQPQWDSIPTDTVLKYQQETEQVHQSSKNVEEFRKQEAKVYNKYFAAYGFYKPAV